MTEHFRLLAAELAREGFSTVAVDLYGGRTTHDPAEARQLRLGLDDSATLRRAHAGLLAAPKLVGGAPAAVLGFSVGAEFAIRLAAEQPADAAAVVAFYGVYASDALRQLTAPVQLHMSPGDEFATPDEVAEFTRWMRTAGKRLELHSYPGTKHGFFNRSRPEAYHATAAALARRRLLRFLRAELNAGSDGRPTG